MAGALGLKTPDESWEGWMPIRVHERAEPVVEWCWLDGIGFDEPFFVETIERALRTPFSLLFRREMPIELLDELEPGLEPSGFVFHGSRCGSTLVSQLLGSSPRNLVLSEPPPVDQVLRAEAPVSDRVRWLRGIVSALGRPRRDSEQNYVVKFDAWSTCSLDLVVQAFPEVPRVFLFRDPVQVLASHLRRRGAHMVPGVLDSRLFGLSHDEVERMRPEEYCARVLAAIYGSALEHRGGRAFFVDYEQLPEALFNRILDAFGLELDENELTAMRELTDFDAKSPRLFFSPDSAAKEAAASPALRAAADRFVRPVYEELLEC